jgi:hypothetical protein
MLLPEFGWSERGSLILGYSQLAHTPLDEIA